MPGRRIVDNLELPAPDGLVLFQDLLERPLWSLGIELFGIQPSNSARVSSLLCLRIQIHTAYLRQPLAYRKWQPPNALGHVVDIFDGIRARAGSIDGDRLQMLLVDTQIILHAGRHRSDILFSSPATEQGPVFDCFNNPSTRVLILV